MKFHFDIYFCKNDERVGRQRSIFWHWNPSLFFSLSKTFRCAHRNLRSYDRRSMSEKMENFFQLVSTLFCELKRGFVDC
jgi:hypothetical protein